MMGWSKQVARVFSLGRRRTGQVALYLLLALLAIAILVMMNVNIFLAVRGKNRLTTAGDAAALAAARVQASLINSIGKRNLDHIKAAYEGNSNECARIELEQRHLALLGPLDAIATASDAARQNGAAICGAFNEILAKHAEDVRIIYAGGNGGFDDPYPESYPGAWADYAAALAAASNLELAAGVDNVEYFNAASPHILLYKAFYEAISAEDWCWFYFYNEALLRDYQSYKDFAPLQLMPKPQSCANSEIYSLHVEPRKTALTGVFTNDELLFLLKQAGIRSLPPPALFGEMDVGLLNDPNQTWFFFDTAYWKQWFDGRRLAQDDPFGLSPGDFPIVGSIRQEYNLLGCAAVCRAYADVQSVLDDSSKSIVWCAAAKPFGTKINAQGETMAVTSLKGFITPCMQDVRLTPVDAVGGSNLSTADLEWVTHVREHIAAYLASGPHIAGASGCFYCRQLSTWEQPSFHIRGVNWLRHHSKECIRPTGGGYIGSGGTSHGH